jgi:hypothetical protein
MLNLAPRATAAFHGGLQSRLLIIETLCTAPEVQYCRIRPMRRFVHAVKLAPTALEALKSLRNGAPGSDLPTEKGTAPGAWVRRELVAHVAMDRGDLDAAERSFAACRDQAHSVSRPDLVAKSMEGLASVATRRGQLRRLRGLLDEAPTLEETGLCGPAVELARMRAMLASDEGNFQDAEHALTGLISRSEAPQTREVRDAIAACLLSRAAVRWLSNCHEAALQDLGACEQMLPSDSIPAARVGLYANILPYARDDLRRPRERGS